MSDHEFEKQVQRKMDELKIRPSDAVWTEVQKNIRQNKRRRRFGFWLPVFFVFLATTGYILYTHNQSSTLPISQSKHVARTNSTSSNNNNLHNDNNSTQIPNNNDAQNAQDKYLEPEQPNSIIVQNNDNTASQHSASPQSNRAERNNMPLRNNNAVQQNSAPLNPNGTQQNTAPLHNNNTAQQNRTPLNNNYPTQKRAPLHNNNTTQQNRTQLNSNDIAAQQNNTTNNTSTTEATEQEPTLAATMPTTAPREDAPISTSKADHNLLKIFAPEKQNSTASAMPVQPIQKQKGPKWQWGIQASVGYSRISQTNLFNLNGLLGSPEKNRAEDLALRSPAPPGYQQSTYISVAPPIEKKAAPIQADLAYSAGVFVQKPLSKRLRLTIGLQYTYMSAHTTVGKLVEKSTNVNLGAAMQRVVPSYYTIAETKDDLAQSQLNMNYTPPVDSAVSQQYNYRFHSIELPVMINWQINKGRRLPPFVLDAGISIARMWSIDALHFDGIKGIYYKNDDLFNKTQLNAIMGLNVGLFQRSKFPVWIGPSLRYSITGLLKKEVSKGQFLWSTGINVRVGLNRL